MLKYLKEELNMFLIYNSEIRYKPKALPVSAAFCCTRKCHYSDNEGFMFSTSCLLQNDILEGKKKTFLMPRKTKIEVLIRNRIGPALSVK